jgi:hypothetical protein
VPLCSGWSGGSRRRRWLASVEAIAAEQSSPLSVVAACDGGGGKIYGCQCGGRLVGCSLLAREEEKKNHPMRGAAAF